MMPALLMSVLMPVGQALSTRVAKAATLAASVTSLPAFRVNKLRRRPNARKVSPAPATTGAGANCGSGRNR